MQILPGLMNRLGYVEKHKAAKHFFMRGWKAANQDRLTHDWQSTSLSADGELLYRLKILRARARDLWMNDDYAKRYIGMLTTNIIGAKGIILQNKAIEDPGKFDVKTKKYVGRRFDNRANEIIEDAFKRWGKKGVCEVTGKMSWVKLQGVVIESAGRDGEIFVRKVRGWNNGFGFALQLLEADYCPDEYNVEALPNGNRVVMGIEIDTWGRTVAYYFTAKHPGDGQYLYVNQKYLRIPAEEIIHVFDITRAHQTRGYPWMITPATRLKMLNAYEEAEVVAARAGASKMGFFEEEVGGEGVKYTGDKVTEDKEVISEFEPGTMEKLPPGLKFQGWDPQHPNSNYGQFHKDVLRSISSGLEVSYNALANDLESTSYSSGRIGVLEERENWKKRQSWMIDVFHQPVFESWLDMALLTGQVNLPMVKYDKFNAPTWHARGWDWVDPSKDSKANIESLDKGLKTYTEILAEKGKDFEEHMQQCVEEREYMKEMGLQFTASPAAVKSHDDDNDDGDDGDNQGRDKKDV